MANDSGKRKRKRKPVKYKAITFKLSARQKKSLEIHCRMRQTTPIKLIKKSIDQYLTLTGDEKPISYVTMNQLSLFSEQDFNY